MDQLHYPIRRNYQHVQSSIRYQYKHDKFDPNGQRTNQQIRNYISWENNNSSSFHYVNSSLLIVVFEIFRDIIKFWDEKSHDINNWYSCYFINQNVETMLKALRSKYRSQPERIQFFNVNSIYTILKYKPKEPFIVQKKLFKLWVMASENQNESNYLNLLHLIEGLAKSQLIYAIPNYPSRGNRSFVLPWEETVMPDIKYQKKYNHDKIKKRISMYSVNKNNAQSKAKSDIRNYFKAPAPTSSNNRKRKLNRENHIKQVKKRKFF